MLYIPMYHYASERKRGNDKETLKRHFEYYANNFHSALPRDELSSSKPNLCITFDDGYKDFADTALPLLNEFGLKAILAISPDITCKDETGAHLSWDELNEILKHKNIEIAAHGLTHTLILEPEHAAYEAREAKRLIEEKLAFTPRCFVYPYGKFTVEAHKEVKKEYDFVFRIGGAANIGWGQNMLYRFSADNTPNIEKLFCLPKKVGYTLRFFMNEARGV